MYLLSAYYVPGPADAQVNKTDVISVLVSWGLLSEGPDQQITNYQTT